MRRVDGKVAVVTGGGSGIGRAICHRLAEEGAEVVVTSRTQEHVEKVADDVEAICGRRPLAFTLDVGSSDSARSGVERVVERHGRIDILSNQVAIELARAPEIGEATDDEWEQVLRLTLSSYFWVCRAALPHMGQGAAIVNMASIGSFFAWPGEGLFSTTKGGVLQLTRQLALEGAARGIRANCVCPGIIDTPPTQRYLADLDNPGARRELESLAPLRRIGTPKEVADCVLFLASGEASFVTGSALVVDGGVTLSPAPNE